MYSDFLKLYGCDTRLYERILEIKRDNGSWAESVKVEVSIKTGEGAASVMGRWTLTMLIDEFRQFSEEEQTEILQFLGFSRTGLPLDNIAAGSDIIFGGDSAGLGKVYIDTGNGLTCYESNGRVKYYIQESRDLLRVYSNGELISYHIRVNGEDNIHWMAVGKDFRTYYIRPVGEDTSFFRYIRYLIGID